MEASSSKIYSAVPVIATDDIDKTLAYYTEVLGFEFDFKYGEPPVYAGVTSGQVEVYFTHDPYLANTLREKNLNPDVFFNVPDADSLFEAHKNNGAEIIETVSDRPWGLRQYVIRDINGYHLKFAQPL
jgi:catechol 2,3-dioxygenase-like lactoylglutathione lyase family enzyme